MNFDGVEYEDDLSPMDASEFSYIESKWACSVTGVFMDNEKSLYIATDTTNNESSIYTTARIAPMSLKYYGLCLLKGSYTVKLHFAEIIFTDDQTFSNLGKRIFDVFIQVSDWMIFIFRMKSLLSNFFNWLLS